MYCYLPVSWLPRSSHKKSDWDWPETDSRVRGGACLASDWAEAVVHNHTGMTWVFWRSPSQGTLIIAFCHWNTAYKSIFMSETGSRRLPCLLAAEATTKVQLSVKWHFCLNQQFLGAAPIDWRRHPLSNEVDLFCFKINNRRKNSGC